MTLKFSDFQFVSINCLKIKHNWMSGLFCIADLSEVGRKIYIIKCVFAKENMIITKKWLKTKLKIKT